MLSARTLLGVAGWPVAHSRSPAMHAAALAAMGLDWLYLPLPLAPERFEAAARAFGPSGFRGINVTVPHKKAAHALADRRSEAAAAIGAANTLTYDDGAVEADNTDAAGLIDALAGEALEGRSAVVLGAGGSARAAAWALREQGAEVAVVNRTRERARALARDLGVSVADSAGGADLLVNCTTVGLDPGLAPEAARAALGLDEVDPPALVVDLVYGAGPTPVEQWAARGAGRFVGGLEVLVRQGARSLESWTGRKVPADVMRAAVR